MRAKQVRKMVLSLLLSAIMVVEPAAGSIVAYAAEPGSEQTISFDESDSEDAESESEDVVGEDVSDENTSDETGSEQDGSNEDISDENGDEQDMSDENDSEEENTEDPTDGSEDLEEEPEEDIENPDNGETSDIEFSVPSNYILSTEQRELKADLAANMASFDESEEGNLYVEREVIALADTKEEAEIIAEAYQAELTEYSLGVATLKLKENVSVGKAVYAAASIENNLPPVFPNYYRYAHTIEVQDDLDLGEGYTETYQMGAMAYNDPFLQADSSNYQWQHVDVGSVYAWDEGYKGSGIKVAVLDTGVTSPNASELTVLGNYNTSASSTADDMQGHGTHVAGIIAAQLNNNYRGAGIAPEAKIYNVKVLSDDGRGGDDTITRGIKQAIDLGVDLINMSLGGISYSPLYEPLLTEAYEKGIAVFASAGNDGGSTMCYPAAYDHVICVAAVDSNNQRASFSNYGSWVDLSAPGVGIWSITSTAAYSDGYVSMDGTSQACPVAVGEAAVILAANPEALNGKSGKDRVEALEKFMKANTVSAGSGMGKGITSLTKALKLSVMTAKPTTPTITATYDNAETPQMVTISIAAGAGAATDIYYTVDGKNPTFKNGLPGATTLPYDESFSISDKKSGTIKAIAVNSQTGVSSAVAQYKFTLKPYVKTIEISGPTQVAKGKSIQLSAEVGPDYAANKNVEWVITPADGTSAGSGVSITQKGKVTVTASATEGTYNVIAKAKDGSTISSKEYAITVINTVKVKSIKFKATKLTEDREAADKTIDMGKMGEDGFLTVTAEDSAVTASASDLKWTSSNKAIATVSDMGVVTLKAPGTATITALANDGSNKKATCKITVKQLSTGVSIEGPTQLAKGKKITLKATVAPANVSNKKVTWSATGPDTEVKVNAKGVVTATSKAAGEYVIMATPADGKGTPKTHTITVKSGVITGISMSDKTAKIFRVSNAFTAKDSTTITATIKGNNDDFAANALTLTSSNTGVATATMSQAGNDVTITVKATGKATGTTKITLASTDGSNKKATCTVTVVNPVSRINIATGGNSRYVAQGKSLQLKATLESEYGAVSNKGVTWTIDDTDSGVKINASKGKVTASKNAKVGTDTEPDRYGVYRPVPMMHKVTATAKDGSGVSVTFNIYVTQPVKGLQLYYIYDLDADGSPLWKKWPSNVAMAYSRTDVEDIFILDWDNYTLTGGPDTIYGNITLSSSNPSVVSISTYQGYVDIVTKKKGSATITIKAMDGGGASIKRKIIVR